MKTIAPPLRKSNEGTAVKNLHYILFFLTQKMNDSNVNNFFGDPAFRDAYGKEVSKQFYGSATVKFVNVLQEHFQLQQVENGAVDNPTAEKFNEMLREFQGLDIVLPDGYPFDVRPDEDPVDKSLRVYGVVRNEFGELLSAVTVMAFDKDLRNEELLGSKTTQEGKYEILYKRAQFINAEKDAADLVVKVLDANGQLIHKTSVMYNVPDEVEVNIALNGSVYAGPSEFETLTGTITPLLDGLSPLELREDEEHQDLTFLYGESGITLFLLNTWVLSHRIAARSVNQETPLEAAVFFAFMRLGQPASILNNMLQDLKYDERVVLLEERIMKELANIQPESQQALLEKAVTDNLVPGRIKAQLKDVLNILNQIKLKFTASMTFGAGKGTISQLLDLNPDVKAKQNEFMTAFTSHQGPIKGLWKQLEKDNVLPAETIKAVKLTFDLGTLTRNHIPLVAELRTMFQRGEIKSKRELAKNSVEDWQQILRRQQPDGVPIGFPPNIDGDNNDTKIREFAGILEQRFERSYPTTAFAGKLSRTEGSPVNLKKDVVRFIENNPTFQLDRYRLDHYLVENADALKDITDKEGTVKELKSVQRVFRLQPTFKVVDALLGAKLDSAQKIYFMGKEQFMHTMEAKGINKLDAKKLYQKSEISYTMALAFFGKYNKAVNGVEPFGIPSQVEDAEAKAKISVLPNLQTLFGSLDYCECTHCRSVYSPAAYFVDVMHFLNERNTQGTGINAGKNVKQVLLERRPDLGEIELSCENTNTPLPYIDLVNEVLEDIVTPPTPMTVNVVDADLVGGKIKQNVFDELKSKSVTVAADAEVYDKDIRGQYVIRDSQHSYKLLNDAGVMRLLPTKQTFLTSAELRANPAYTNKDAYDKLKQEIFPLSLPFDLWYVQIRTYLNHLGVHQAKLFELFQQKLADNTTLSPGQLEIDCSILGITEMERKIITGSLPAKSPWDFWGLSETGNDIPNPENPADATQNFKGAWKDVLSHVSIMLHRSGLTYTELLQLLDMKYVNPDDSIFIFTTADPNAANCDSSKFIIRMLTEDALNRMHRFIRLWKKLKIEMWELDMLLPDKNPDPNITDKQITDTVLQDLSMLTRLRDRFPLDWRTLYSLFNNIDNLIYVNRSKDNAQVQTLYQRLFLNKLVDAVAAFPEAPAALGGPVADKIPGMLAALQINEVDLHLVLNDLSMVPTDTLDHTKLTQIFRITVLSKALSLSIDHFLRLKKLWAKDPFANPGAAWAFAALAEKISESSFSIAELDYILANQFRTGSGVAIEIKAIVSIIEAIREGLLKIHDDIHLKKEETTEAYVKSKLGLLPAMSKDADQIIALSIVDGTWEGSTAARSTLIKTYFKGVLDVVQADVKLSAIAPGLSPADRRVEVNKRYDYVQPDLEFFLMQTQKQVSIKQKIAEVFQLEFSVAAALLEQLQLPGSALSLLDGIMDARLTSKKPDDSFDFLIDESNFPAIFKALRLLHKNALLTKKLNIKSDDLIWWLEGNHAADLGWMHPKDLPLDSTTSLALVKWEAVYDLIRWKDNLPASELTAFEFLDVVLDPASVPTDMITSMALLTGWNEKDVNDLVAAFRWDVKQEFKNSISLTRLADCFGATYRLGVTASRAIEWATSITSNTIAESLKQTVKAKYDLPQWLQVIQPIQDEFREQKRNALVTWLITHPNQLKGQNWQDANGLYSYFLIDVEMSACMLTSRLKQAAATAQLFVQRCLLNLEVDILATASLDSKWKQWKWMKYYRVWEANRKVFLYPENWIEPELRDEKSVFFKELENELMQNDITADTVEQAYLTYLEKLDKVANLEIRTMYNEARQDESVLHVFARSRSSLAPEHYYRKRINGARWTAWEKMDLDITANHLIAGIHNRRLYLLWPQFLEKAVPPATIDIPETKDTMPIKQPDKYWEIRLYWSELKKGKWTPKILSDNFVRIDQAHTSGNKPENVVFNASFGSYIPVTLLRSKDPGTSAPVSADDFFGKVGKQINKYTAGASQFLLVPSDSQLYNNLLRHPHKTYYAGNFQSGGGKIDPSLSISPQAPSLSVKLLSQVGSEMFTVVNLQGIEGSATMFVWDTDRAYTVDYNFQEEGLYVSKTFTTKASGSFRFYIHYHPFVELFIKELNTWGIKGLLNRTIQVDPSKIPGSPPLFNFEDYKPTSSVVKSYKLPDKSFSYPLEDVDFTYNGAYAPYNWELFFHVPFYIANKLSSNQRFEESLEWYHYIFDPTSTYTAVANPDTPQQKYWITKPFYETTKTEYYKQKIENIMLAIAKGDTELQDQVKEWRSNPFNPHLIARMRTTAYQKNVLIKYILTLIAWADQLFRRDTMESINEATQLYILAASILGPRPKSIPRKIANPVKTFYQLEKEGIDDFGNVLKEIENLLPPPTAAGTMDGEKPELPRLNVLYFCIPNNEKLLGLWDTVDDRLFKIRHCMNIEGMVRKLPLFDPPIDPGLLVKATAAGLDIGTVLNEMNSPMPLYRFTFLIQRAQELCNEVKSMGSALFSALEKKDADAISLLRSSHELILMDETRKIKEKQIDETLRIWEGLQESRKVIEERYAYYDKLSKDGLNGWETASLLLTGGAIVSEIVASVLNAVGTATSLIPDVEAGAAGFGGSPHMTLKIGGSSVTRSIGKASDVAKSVANVLQMTAGMTATIGSFNRRAEEWNFQSRVASKELPPMDKQIAGADIRHQIAQQDLSNHDKRRENLQKEDEYMHSKFTNQELYDWQINQLSTTYFQSYQQAYDLAKRAERCFRYELGLGDSNYIQFGYWDSLKKGLLCGEKLYYDLKRLETAYYEQNRREYELTKHISLSRLDPIALLKLRQNGSCLVDIPETAFDMDYPGHYFRRIKTVGLTIPCVAGPHTTIACTLTLVSNKLRKDATLSGNKYERDPVNEDLRFRDEVAAIQSIASSNAQNDNGLFELNFRDDRYLPFEGAGAISTWHIQLNKDFPQFDYSTISDIILHLSYTAREGGELLKSKAVENFNKKLNDQALSEGKDGLYRVYDLKREFSDKVYKFLHPSNPADDQELTLENLQDMLPYFTTKFKSKKVKRLEVVSLMKEKVAYKVMLSPLGNQDANLLSLVNTDTTYKGLHRATKDLAGAEAELGSWTLKIKKDGVADFKSLPVDALEELFLIVNYTIA